VGIVGKCPLSAEGDPEILMMKQDEGHDTGRGELWDQRRGTLS
jgi:hypothetical protein